MAETEPRITRITKVWLQSLLPELWGGGGVGDVGDGGWNVDTAEHSRSMKGISKQGSSRIRGK